MPVEFGMHSSRSISSLLCFGGNAACSDRLDLMSSVRSLRAVDPVQAAKND
ncbi:hypothetical protein PC129_g17008 [Phytophthora cactorum]|nr:hypothetical protein Pcac1_g2197 [Phytophthora cactorum]KAG2883973.1 hypothetical protein PC114_g20343 [Phytophthora cactorum]KAG2910005.1 hypothetical protein PC117_g19523 [Phytophthora cactorum]KAG2990290.1 hypothetical protein PC119_g19125 [Phytophthora cactorum]KAG3003573.1 hypothetical protein PC120_g19056 [Phytophthora cactorum]